jgi:hypothetical protein
MYLSRKAPVPQLDWHILRYSKNEYTCTFVVFLLKKAEQLISYFCFLSSNFEKWATEPLYISYTECWLQVLNPSSAMDDFRHYIIVSDICFSTESVSLILGKM